MIVAIDERVLRMDWMEEKVQIEFEEVKCICNTRSNARYIKLYNLMMLVLMVIGVCFIPINTMLSITFICLSVLWCVIGAIVYVSYSKVDHSITFILTEYGLIYTDEKGEVITYSLDQLKDVKRKRMIGWGMCYRFCFDDRIVNVYDGDDLAGLMMGLRTLGKL